MKIEILGSKIDDYYPEVKLSKLLKSVLNSRNYTFDQIKSIEIPLDEEFESYNKIYGITHAADFLIKFIKLNPEAKIIIHGDYDVDGVCATCILWDYLYSKLKLDVFPIIPNRAEEGYGLSDKTLSRAAELNADLIITVDCGIKDVEIIDKYRSSFKFLITDHHTFLTKPNGEIILPQNTPIVHSAHPESNFSSMISGAATAWQFVRALEAKLNILKDNNAEEYIDLVGLSTICDIIPLTRENRKYVIKGLQKIKEGKRVGLNELIKISGLRFEDINAYHLGYVLGPKINAAGRVVHDAIDALRLLATKHLPKAEGLAIKLNELNVERQELTRKFLEKAEKQIRPDLKFIHIVGQNWPEGILGLIAGRLAEKYYKPVFVSSINDEGKITGSSRSQVQDFYLLKSLEAAANSLTNFGGHKQAAGYSSTIELIQSFDADIFNYIENNHQKEDFEKKIEVDLEIPILDMIELDEVKELDLLEPFGYGNKKPVFYFRNVKIIDLFRNGKSREHTKITLTHNTSSPVEAMAFNCDFTPDPETSYDFIGNLEINEWKGNRKIQISIKVILENGKIVYKGI